ncbi:diguanylate cyclase [Actinotalea sp.]|uniref:diguanylate cyclase n=1 Tax=Actinotalea sp. TaxID=1872145 RepID=UPI002BBCD5CF|nr:diguanylate cyclase [Actinotalea sp.]HQY33554.1 diguanylate cyclase [Actinotalea sp.]HRA49626.1 diguanylate cyclase [Actinotalea sp.]
MAEEHVRVRASDRELAQTLDLLSERVARYRVDDLTLVYCNRAWAAQHHADPEELVGIPIDDLLSPAEIDGLHAQLARLGPLTPYLRDSEPRPATRMPDRWIEWADRYLVGPDGAHILAVGRDVTERRLAEQRLALSEARFRDLADRSADAVFRLTTTPRPHLSYLSPSVERITGWSPADFGDDLAHLVTVLDTDSRSVARGALAGATLPDRFDVRMRRADGTGLVLELQVVALDDGVQGVGRDVTEMRRLQDDLATLALRDPLTGLANRRLFDILLSSALARVQRSTTPLVVTYVDLDDFKSVNDTYGHAAGDAVLVETARRLKATVRGADIVARLGGDEFVVAQETDADGAEATAHRIGEALEPAYELPDGTLVTCTASLGIAESRLHPVGASLLAAADAAMYAAKRVRHGRDPRTGD